MRANVLRQVLIVAVVLAVVAGVWLLPRALRSGAATPPASIELRSERAPTTSPGASPEPRTVDDPATSDDDDGDDRAESNREDRRSNRESVPQTGTTSTGDDHDDDGGDDDDDDGGDDDLGDDDD